MRSFIVAVALGAAFASAPFVQVSHAGTTTKLVAKGAHPVKGTISSIDGTTVVVSVANKKTGTTKDQKIKTDDSTKITLDGKDAKLADLKAGQLVEVTRGEGKGAAAATIAATSAADAAK
jgi:hypothetical protein